MINIPLDHNSPSVNSHLDPAHQDGIALNSMSHADLPPGDPLRTLCDDHPEPECLEAIAKLIWP